MISASVGQPVCLSRLKDVQKRLSGSTSFFFCRLLGTQEALHMMGVTISPRRRGGCSMRLLPNYFGHLFKRVVANVALCHAIIASFEFCKAVAVRFELRNIIVLCPCYMPLMDLIVWNVAALLIGNVLADFCRNCGCAFHVSHSPGHLISGRRLRDWNTLLARGSVSGMTRYPARPASRREVGCRHGFTIRLVALVSPTDRKLPATPLFLVLNPA